MFFFFFGSQSLPVMKWIRMIQCCGVLQQLEMHGIGCHALKHPFTPSDSCSPLLVFCKHSLRYKVYISFIYEYSPSQFVWSSAKMLIIFNSGVIEAFV